MDCGDACRELKAALKDRLLEKENHRDINERHAGLTDGDRCTTWRRNSLASAPAAVDPGTRKEGLPGFRTFPSSDTLMTLTVFARHWE